MPRSRARPRGRAKSSKRAKRFLATTGSKAKQKACKVAAHARCSRANDAPTVRDFHILGLTSSSSLDRKLALMDTPSPHQRSSPEHVAVVDIGATSIRMAIGEIAPSGKVRTLDTLSQAVSLGRDTFTDGSIRKSTIEECVHVLGSYRRKLAEYQITDPDRIRVVATSAVREARNRMSFIDRVYIATGFEIQPLDEAEVNRVTYLGVQRHLRADSVLASAKTMITEVGGGNTEVLLVQEGNVLLARTFRLGSLRLRKTLEAYRPPAGKVHQILRRQLKRNVDEISEQLSQMPPTKMIAMGGDIRFAAAQLLPNWRNQDSVTLPVSALEAFTNQLAELSEDRIVHRYHLSFPEAETIGLALLTNVMLAKAFDIDELLITNTNLRDGLLHEMARKDAWTDDFCRQIIRSAVSLGRKYDFDMTHATHVADLAKSLFEQLQTEHHLDSHYAVLLYVAALLHEIGAYISNRSMHKHSMYLIRHSEIFGLGKSNLLLVALVARYHRRASPQPNHEGYATLDRDLRVAVAKLAAILRVAVALDDSRSQRIRNIKCTIESSRLVIAIPRAEDLSLEQLALKQNGMLFEEVFGFPVLLRVARLTCVWHAERRQFELLADDRQKDPAAYRSSRKRSSTRLNQKRDASHRSAAYRQTFVSRRQHPASTLRGSDVQRNQTSNGQ